MTAISLPWRHRERWKLPRLPWRREKPELTPEELAIQERQAREKAVHRWEKVNIFYQDGQTDVIEAPQDMLVKHLDVRCRYRPNSIGPWVMGFLLGILLGPSFMFGLAGLIAWPFDPWGAYLWGIAFSPLGVLFGPVLATWWILKSRFAPHPFWVAQMTPDDGLIPLVARAYSRSPTEGYRSAMESFEVLEARDQEDWISSGGDSIKKVAIIGVGLILLGVLWISLMLIIATGEQ